MNVTYTDNKLQIEGRVDSTNAGQMEEELFSVYPGGDVEIDLAKLSYISSAGLRVLLKVRKQTEHVKLINTSPEIYEILEITGFTDLFEVTKA